MSRLAKILEDQLAEAKAKAGSIIIRKLNHGLRIELMCVSSEVRLTLTRDDKYPSIQEWETVMKYFPFEVEKISPVGEQKGGRYIISARFANQRSIQAKFF